METKTIMTGMRVEEIPLVDILADEEFNCRGPILPIDVVDLAKDIEENNLIQPVLISPLEGKPPYKYRLIAGFRRFMAHKVLKRDKIPSAIRSEAMPETQARILNLSENLKRKDLNVLQEAKAIDALNVMGLGESEIAKKLGMSRGWVQIRTMLLKLPKEVQKEVEVGMVGQLNIRELYMIHRTGNMDALYKAVRTLKDAKIRGIKNASVHIEKTNAALKRHRDKAELVRMTVHIVDTIGSCAISRAMAWASGEIDTDALFLALENYADQHGLTYVRPDPVTLKPKEERGTSPA